MKSDDDWKLWLLLYAAIAALTALALHWLGGFLGDLEQHVLGPILRFIKDYFENYGRVTAALILFLATVAGLLFFNFKEKESMSKTFRDEQNMKDKHISVLIGNAKISSESLLEKSTQLETTKSELLRRNERFKLLEMRNQNLEDEIEKLRNPEKVALEAAVAVKESKDAKLKNIVNSIQWGRT